MGLFSPRHIIVRFPIIASGQSKIEHFLERQLIYIKNACKKGQLTVTFTTLLKDIESVSKEYSWSFFDLEAVGEIEKYMSVKEIREVISCSSIGYHLTWEKLYSFSNVLSQITILYLVADESKIFTRKSHDTDIYSSYLLVIAIKDNSFWEITTLDESLVQLFLKKYKHIEAHIIHNKD